MIMLKLDFSFNSVASGNIEEWAMSGVAYIVIFLETTYDTLPIVYVFCDT